MLAAGSLDLPVRFMRRVPVPATIGGERGGYVDFGSTWGGLKTGNSLRIAVGDFHGSVPTGVLTVRDDPMSRTVDAAFQAVIEDEIYEVRSADRDRRSGTIRMEVVGANGRTIYAQAFDRDGEVVVLRRKVPGGPDLEVNARARVSGYQLEELVGGVAQGARRVLLSAEDLDAASWSSAPRRNDKIVLRGRLLNVDQVDDSTHRVGGVLLAYEITATG